MNSKKGVGGRLVDAREQRGLTQNQLAALAGVSQSMISQIEQGKITNPGVFTVRVLERALRIPDGELTRGLESDAA